MICPFLLSSFIFSSFIPSSLFYSLHLTPLLSLLPPPFLFLSFALPSWYLVVNSGEGPMRYRGKHNGWSQPVRLVPLTSLPKIHGARGAYDWIPVMLMLMMMVLIIMSEIITLPSFYTCTPPCYPLPDLSHLLPPPLLYFSSFFLLNEGI